MLGTYIGTVFVDVMNKNTQIVLMKPKMCQVPNCSFVM